jgi:hypothetical protein
MDLVSSSPVSVPILTGSTEKKKGKGSGSDREKGDLIKI